MRVAPVLALVLLLGPAPAASVEADCTGVSVGHTPLNDLGTGEYRGAQGGLYPGGTNERPADHDDAGRALADAIGPLNAAGNPDPGGRYVLLSIGMSNTTQEFSVFRQWAMPDPRKDPRLVIVDGAQGGMHAGTWSDPDHQAWDRADQRLAGSGVTPQQVVAAWVKVANPGPSGQWPAEAERLREQNAQIARNLKARYPNIVIAYHSSRIYAGYATTGLNPEPYAYESGFGVKWALGDQIAGDPSLNFDPGRGEVVAPWMAWGPYLWADGLNPRSDGLTWECSNFAGDGTHPSQSGREKVASMLMEHFTSDATATPWFVERAGVEDAVGDANYVNDQGLQALGIDERGPDTRPASIDSADLISAWYETTYEVAKDRDEQGRITRVRHVPTGLLVHWRTAAPAAPSFGPTVSSELWVNVGDCSLIFRMYTRGPSSQPEDPPQRAELRTRKAECPEGALTYTAGITLSFDGPVATMTFPFSALGPPGIEVFGAGDTIVPDADGNRPRVATVHRPQAGGLLLGGPVIDMAPHTAPFVVGSDLPPDIDCGQTPAHPDCQD